MEIREIQAMLKLIPNGVVISPEDLEEIYSQDEIQSSKTLGNTG